MAVVAHFVSILLAKKWLVLFLVFSGVVCVPSFCSGNEMADDPSSRRKVELQNGEENVEVFGQNFKGKNEKIFGQLQSRVVVADGEAISDNLGNKYNTRGVYDCVGLLVIYCLLLIYLMFADFHKY